MVLLGTENEARTSGYGHFGKSIVIHSHFVSP